MLEKAISLAIASLFAAADEDPQDASGLES